MRSIIEDKRKYTYVICITEIPKKGVHFNLELMKELHKIGQRAFEKSHSKEEFMRIFGKII